MNEIAQQSHDLYEILGVNVCTHICPNLESFNRFLVTGKGAKSVGNPLFFIGPEIEENSQEIFEQIIHNTKQLLLESQYDVGSSKTNSFSILINNPFENSGYNPFKSPQDEKLFTLLKENFGLALKHTSAISGNFGNAMLEALSLIDHSSQEFVILISIFQYKSFDFKKKAIVGFGSLLLSHNTKENSALVRLSNVDQSDLLNDDEEVRPLVPDKSNNEIKHFIHAPIIQMIGAILELHHKSYFLLLHNKLLIEKIANDEFEGIFIRPWFPPPFKENRKQILSIGDSCQFYLEEYFERRELSYDSFNNFE